MSFYASYPFSGSSGGGAGTDVNIHDSSGANILNGQKTMANSLPVVVASDQTAIPVAAASLPLPTGAATAAKQDTGNTSLASIDGKLATLGQKAMAGSEPVVIASDQSAIPISAASLPLPTGAATEATLSTMNGKFGTLGQKAMAGSAPVVIASDQSAVPVSAASLPLPTGAATGANQATEIASLASIDGKLASLGQKTMAGSEPVVIASDQSALPTKAPVNSNGSIVNTSLTATTASSASAPANAVGFILEAPTTNTDNIRWCIGGTASTTVGMLAEPGRDTGYVPCAATISVCAIASGTNAFSIQWVLSS